MIHSLTPTMTILYVDSPEASAAFYQKLFSLGPVEVSPTFAMFVLPGGLVFGLWSRHTVVPAATLTGGGCEVAIRAPKAADVDATFAAWQALGVSIVQSPTDAEFGRTFLAVDLDGHRIRVFTPPA
jgi:predicted enzyme related to lactoylglutathione lyase